MKTEVSKLGLGLRIQNSRFKINLECVKLRSYNIKVESENLNVGDVKIEKYHRNC